MSNTILEAMASGLPVVATNVGGADEMVVDGETGILVPPRDSNQLADALDRLASSELLRHAMGRAGRARAHAEFSLEHMIENYHLCYCDVIQRKKA
jgi:glycosyltransferase involved in cell wall biosynthesis